MANSHLFRCGFLAACCLLSGCDRGGRDALARAEVAQQPRAECPSLDDPAYYFAADALMNRHPPNDPEWDVGEDARDREHYSKHLVAIGEPSLSCGVIGAEEIYRFLYIRTFDHPIGVRIARTGENVVLTSVVLEWRNDYEPGNVLSRSERVIPPDQWALMTNALDRAGFWAAPTHLQGVCWGEGFERRCMNSGLDGARWVFEGRRGDDYRVIDRWSPDDDPFVDLGKAFLDLSGLDIPDRDIY